MRNVLDTMYRLTERGDAGPACDDNGVTLGPVILVEAVAAGGRRAYRSRSSEEIAHASHFNSLSGENVPLKIEADVKVQTQDETVSGHYTWTIALPPGGLAYAPLKDIPPLDRET